MRGLEDCNRCKTSAFADVARILQFFACSGFVKGGEATVMKTKRKKMCMGLSALMLVCHAPFVSASTTVCVTSEGELQQALTDAQTATADTFIKIATGKYSTTNNNNGAFFYQSSTNTHQLELTGGYNSDCSSQTQNPYLTVFDGNAADLVIQINADGGVSVRWLTVQNGVSPFRIDSQAGPIVANYNVLRNNRFGSMFLSVDSLSASNKIEAWGNLIHDNMCADTYVPAALNNQGLGDIYFTNNTVANNFLSSAASEQVAGITFVTYNGTAYLSNNIFWNNLTSGADPIDVDIHQGPSVLSFNDIGTFIAAVPPTVNGGFSTDPQFVSDSNFRLALSSPLLQQGTLAPAGGLPTIDLLGRPRTFDGTVDLGVFERNDDIFEDGFDKQ